MKSSKDTFLEMREEQISTLYDSTFTKKEAIKAGADLVTVALDNGNVNIMEFGANLVRLNEVIGSAVTEFRKHIIDAEKQTVFGIEFTPTNGGNTINYKDCEVWLELQSQMKHRESLLKVALTSNIEIYDENGVLVPKVSTSPRSSSITIKF